MFDTILESLLPVVATLALGFWGAKRSDFRRQDAAVLNRLALTYALPLMLIVGTASTPRAELAQDIPLLIALCIAVIGVFGLVFLLSRFVFAVRTSISALAALAASAPAVPFMGPAILGELFGRSSAIPIAMASLVINLTVVPATILFLTADPVQENSQGDSLAAPATARVMAPAAGFSFIAAKLWETVQEPLVWGPAVGLVIALSSWHVPTLVLHTMSLLGHATGGVSLFAAGIVLASGSVKASWPVTLLVILKNLVQPALVLTGLHWLGYGNPILREAVLATAIPAMPIVAMLALQYHVGETVAASSLFYSVIGSVITLPAFILLTT
jgi:malonate transporter and related proteins